MTETYPLDDDTIAQLFTTLIWQAPHDPGLDTLGYTRSDIPVDEQDVLIGQFREFCRLNDADVRAFMAHTGRDMTDVAHDYILTCNGHGAGFWDRCYCGTGGLDEPAERLTEACRHYGNVDLDRADDGSLYIL